MAGKTRKSAGILLYRYREDGIEVFLVHPGGPFWAKKDLGAWSIPKGELEESDDSDPLRAARREFEEETGVVIQGEFVPLAPVKLKSGKVVLAWLLEGDLDPEAVRSNTFSIEWPPHSGKQAEFPEIDRAAFFSLEEAQRRIHPGQAPFLAELESRLGENTG
jgi:predicted NUDIX family NTP pyrophosphohydrolase